MIAALCWLVGALSERIAARKRERNREPRAINLTRTIEAWKRERIELNPALRVRTRIPKVGKL